MPALARDPQADDREGAGRVHRGRADAGLVCDLIVAAEDAFFADPVVRMGIPGVEYFAHPWVLGPRPPRRSCSPATGSPPSGPTNGAWSTASCLGPTWTRETFAIAEQIAAMPQFGLALTKRAVNQCEDVMGMRTGMDSVFGLHHFAHAHNAEVGRPIRWPAWTPAA